MSEPLPKSGPERRDRSHRCRRVLSRPADQFRTALVPTLGAAALLVVLVATVHQVNAARVKSLAEANPGIGDILESQAVDMETTLALSAIIYLFGILAVGLVHSRRLIGALFAMNRRILRMGEGDLGTSFRLRRGDYFHDVADSINGLATELRRQAMEDLADTDDLISIIDRSPQTGALKDGLRGTLSEIRARKRRLLDLPDQEPITRPRLVEAARS